METLRIIPDLETEGFREGKHNVRKYNGSLTIGGMGQGTKEGRPTVMIGLEDDESDSILIVETTLALFLAAADALKAKYGDPREN